MSSQWEFSISAGSYYQSLADSFRGNDIRLAYEDDCQGLHFFGYSSHIEGLTDTDHISQRLYSLQVLLNGALRAATGSIETVAISFNEFYRCEGGGSYSIYADAIEECPFDLDPAIDDELPPWNKPDSNLPALLLNRAKTDSALRSVLFLAGLISTNSATENILTWSTLYKILDSVKHYAREYSLPYESFADQQRVNQFTAACNNMSILGVNARHGASGNTPPQRVITDLQEAIGLMLEMLNRFVVAYCPGGNDKT